MTPDILSQTRQEVLEAVQVISQKPRSARERTVRFFMLAGYIGHERRLLDAAERLPGLDDSEPLVQAITRRAINLTIAGISTFHLTVEQELLPLVEDDNIRAAILGNVLSGSQEYVEGRLTDPQFPDHAQVVGMERVNYFVSRLQSFRSAG